MANGLETKLDLILSEKESKVLPENIKKGVTLFGVNGTLTAGEGVMTEEDYEICELLADEILGGVLPYIPLEYIESTGTQYIDTGLTFDDAKFSYDVKFKLNEITEGGSLLGINKTKSSLSILSSKLTLNGNALFTADTEEHSLTYNRNTGVIEWDNTSTIISTSISDAGDNIHIFNRSGATGTEVKMRLYYLKIYDINDNLIRDFIPVLDEDGVACLLDKTSYTFYYNNGTGVFNAGLLVEKEPLPEGSVLQLIGSKNNGKTFDTSIAYWTNLLDDSRLTVSSGTWSDNALNCSKTEIDTNITQASLVNGYTIIARINSLEWVNYRGLFGLHYSTNSGIIGFQATNGNMGYAHYNKGSAAMNLSNFPINTWITLVARYNSTDKNIQIYSNNQLVTTLTNKELTPQGNIILGKAGDITSSNYYFSGAISHFIIYDRTLTDTEMEQVYTYIEDTI